MILGTVVAASNSYTPTSILSAFGVNITAYTAIWALGLNFLLAGLLTLVLRAGGAGDTADETAPEDYDELVETGRPAPVAGAPTG
jgi:solute:Na+ symporter, SSS family